jgi:hypothetical protein
MRLGEHSPARQRVFRVLERFVDAFSERNAPAHLIEVLDDNKYLKGDELGQKPERFVEDNLIWGVLSALNYDYLPRPCGYPRWDRSTPDFAVTNLDIGDECSTIGEVKTLNKFRYAEKNIVSYLRSDLDTHSVAFATDGIYWRIYFRGRKTDEIRLVAESSFRSCLESMVKRYMENQEYNSHELRSELSGVETLTHCQVRADVREEISR